MSDPPTRPEPSQPFGYRESEWPYPAMIIVWIGFWIMIGMWFFAALEGK